jgi:phosphoribosylaminoimidazole-succinocarboxamide synthase
LVRKVNIIPLEMVVRNYAAGSMAQSRFWMIRRN